MLRFGRTHLLGLILVLGLLHGMFYILLVPPWQHYDEPTQFEYAWLLANRSGLPKPGDYDQAMRRAVAVSMLEHNFFRGMSFLPDLNVQDQPIWIGVSQLDDQPFYYLIASLPLRLLSSWDVTRQLYAGRFVSLVLYLISIIVAWGVMKELAPEGHPLRWMVPLSMVLLPGYVDLMTAVNNDVGATMVFSLFLWGGMRMIRQGLSFRRLLWVGSTGLLCCWTKNTVFLALPLLGLVLFIALFRGRWRWVPWAALITAVPVILVSVFSWGDALFWIRGPNILQKNPTRSLFGTAPLGRYVLQMESAPNESWYSVFQLLPTNQASALRGKMVTLGAWIWATKPITNNALILYDGSSYFSQTIKLSTIPTFFTISATLAEDARRTQVILAPAAQGSQDMLTVFYDGLVLVEGARPLDTVPQFDDPAAQKGTWGGQAFTNLLRNASGETAGPGIRPWVEKLSLEISSAMPSPSLVLGSLLDWRGAGWYYRETAQNLLRTFWAKFGWSHVPLILPYTHRPYSFLAVFTLGGLGGAGMALWRRRYALPWNALLFLGIALAGIWGETLVRGIPSLTGDTVLLTGSRYVYAVIIPTLLVLNAGWLEIAYYVERWTRLASGVKFLVHFLLFLSLDIAALISIVHFYSI